MLSTTLNCCLTSTIWSSVMHMTHIISLSDALSNTLVFILLPLYSFAVITFYFTHYYYLSYFFHVISVYSLLIFHRLFSVLRQQTNFLTGILKVWSYLIKFGFICCGKCESFVEAVEALSEITSKFPFILPSQDNTVLATCFCQERFDWCVTVMWVILHGACINDVEDLHSLWLQPMSRI